MKQITCYAIEDDSGFVGISMRLPLDPEAPAKMGLRYFPCEIHYERGNDFIDPVQKPMVSLEKLAPTNLDTV